MQMEENCNAKSSLLKHILRSVSNLEMPYAKKLQHLLFLPFLLSAVLSMCDTFFIVCFSGTFRGNQTVDLINLLYCARIPYLICDIITMTQVFTYIIIFFVI